MVRNVVFDMGNVLLTYDPSVPLNAFCETKEEKETIRRELFLGPEWIEGDLGNLTSDGKYERVKQRVPKHMHPALKKCVYGWDICLEPVAGAYAFCEYLKGKGYRIFVLSNAGSDFYDYFPRFAPLAYFDGIVVSADLHRIKPDFKIFRHLLETYRLDAKECLFLDDMEENVKAARQVGMAGEVFSGDFERIRAQYGL